MSKSSELDYDSKEIKDYFSHKSGEAGGLLVGKRHSEGGIKAINKSTGKLLEMEGGEIVITRNAVSDDTKREFEGEMLTNKEILSRINQSGGGVAIFEEGGMCGCEGKKYKYGGETLTDFEIFQKISEQDRPYYYSRLSTQTYDQGGLIDERELTDNHHILLKKLKNNPHSKAVISRENQDNIQYLQDCGLIYCIVPKNNNLYLEVRTTKMGNDFLNDYEPRLVTEVEETETMADGGFYRKGGQPKEGDKYFKGLDAEYENQFVLNKAIEELIAEIPVDKFTPEEKKFISYFAGYGGLEKYGAEGVGLMYEYFTPSEIAKRMWGVAYKYAYKCGRVLEPSCGIGEFIKYAPKDAFVTGYEINPVSAKICSILYPNAYIKTEYFEQIFIKNNSSIKDKTGVLPRYDLVIGNPPYGKFQGFYAGMGEKSYTKASNYIEYFITRGLDLLNKGGLLIYVIGTEVAIGGKLFLAQGNSEIKKIISEKAILLDAYRLPTGLFESTDATTEIIVLQKK
jgi:adenine-specific DNA methylase